MILGSTLMAFGSHLVLETRIMDAVHLLPPMWHPRAQRMKRIIARLYNWEVFNEWLNFMLDLV